MAIALFDTENADRDLTSQVAVLTNTPDVSNHVLAIGLIYLGDGVKNLDGSGGLFELTVTVGSQTIEPDPQVIYFSTANRAAIWSSVFPVPANQEVILKVKSPNAADIDVDVTAYLFEAVALVDVSDIQEQTDKLDSMIIEQTAGNAFTSTALENIPDPVNANIVQISGDPTAADNLESQYDETGLTGNAFPATQSQVSGIANVGAATNQPVIAAPNGFVITTGTNEGNDEDSTVALDGVEHSIDDDGGILDVYYLFDITGSSVPVAVTFTGRLNGAGGNELGIYVNVGTQAAPSWSQRGTLDRQGSSINFVHIFTLFTTDVMTGVDAGKVAVRFEDAALSGATLSIDQIFCSKSSKADPTGYSNGLIYVDTNASNTNSVVDVDGTARNPVSTWAAALSLNSSLGFNAFHVANGSSIVLSGNSDGYRLLGEGWTLDLNGQSISSIFIRGAGVSGIGTGVSEPGFDNCHINSVSVPPSHFTRCGFEGTVTAVSAGDFFMDVCHSMVAGTGTPVFDFGVGLNASNINFRTYSGGIEIQNMGAGSGSYNMSLEGFGQLVINANCSATSTVAIRGHFTITDNASGAVTLSNEAMFDHNSIIDGIKTETDKLDNMIIEQSGGNKFTEEALSEARGTNNANTVVPDVAGTAAGLHATTDGLIGALNNITVAQILAGVIEGTITLQQSLRGLMSVNYGKAFGGGTTSIKFRDMADLKNRITETVDANGNRTAVVLDLT